MDNSQINLWKCRLTLSDLLLLSPAAPGTMAPEQKNVTVSLVTGSIAGGLEALCMWPTENIKTQLQLQGKVANPKFVSFSGGVKYVYRNEGIRGLYTVSEFLLSGHCLLVVAIPT